MPQVDPELFDRGQFQADCAEGQPYRRLQERLSARPARCSTSAFAAAGTSVG